MGHVGLPTALGFADLGWSVVGADDDAGKVAQISRGEAPFYEPGMHEALERHLASGRFRVVADVPAAVQESTVLFVCVGTPQNDDGSADLSQIEKVARTVAQHINGYKLIVEKSTTPVRTAEQLKRTLARYANRDHEWEVAVNPEFLKEGTALFDFMNPDRIVLGVESERARDILLEVYRPLLGGQPESASGDGAPPRAVVTDLNTAELIKHASNSFLAMKVSFINMVGDICEATQADVTEVARGLGLDPRIGTQYLNAGAGFGGYCLPKDLRAFIRMGEDNGVDASLLKAIWRINEERVDRLVQKLRQAMWVLKDKTVGLLGLAFKPETDDVREATSIRLIASLLSEEASLRLHDPQAMDSMSGIYPEEPGRVHYCASAAEVASGAHALVVLTEWQEYRELDLASLRDVMEVPVIVDGRNIYDSETVRELGFEYYGMGR